MAEAVGHGRQGAHRMQLVSASPDTRGGRPVHSEAPRSSISCCGHGHDGAYVVIAGRGTLNGAAACAEMRRLGGNPPP
jgi:hypothetical protein